MLTKTNACLPEVVFQSQLEVSSAQLKSLSFSSMYWVLACLRTLIMVLGLSLVFSPWSCSKTLVTSLDPVHLEIIHIWTVFNCHLLWQFLMHGAYWLNRKWILNIYDLCLDSFIFCFWPWDCNSWPWNPGPDVAPVLVNITVILFETTPSSVNKGYNCPCYISNIVY